MRERLAVNLDEGVVNGFGTGCDTCAVGAVIDPQVNIPTITGDTVAHTMSWRGQKELPKGGGPFRLLIELNRSKLYGMSFS